jgi:hypothetical protein
MKGKPEQLLEKLVQEPPKQVLNERHPKKLLVSRSWPAGTREQLMALERSKAPEEIEKWQPKQQIQRKRLDGRLTKGNWSEAELSGDMEATKEETELLELELEHKALEGPMLELLLTAERNQNYRQIVPMEIRKAKWLNRSWLLQKLMGYLCSTKVWGVFMMEHDGANSVVT